MLKSLKVQIALYFFVTSLALLVLIGSIFYYSTSSIVLEDKLESTKASVEQSGRYIEVYIEKLKAVASLIANSPDTMSYLTAPNKVAYENTLTLIDGTLASDESLVSVIIVGKNGEVISNEAELDMLVSGDMMKERWYVDAIESRGMPVLTSARQQKFTMDKETWVISISQEIVDETGRNIGVLLIDIKYQVIEDYLVNMNLGEKGYGFIINDQMGVVYHPDSSYFEDVDKQNELLKISQMKTGYDKSMGMLTHKYQIPQTNWTLYGLSSLDDLGIIKRQILEMIIFAGILVFGIVVGGGLIMAERITNPIQKLEHAMLHFEENMDPIEVDEKGCYEVQSLSRHFNKMILEIQNLMSEIKANEAYLRTYEINALHSQINPHFLYNTLDTIVWMAEFGDTNKVIDVTKSLAKFFRLSLSKGKEMISLADELEHVKMYLFIQEQRYGDNLNYLFEVDDSLLATEVPKIILQPIVENSIYHGIREKGGKGHLIIRADKENECLVLTIKDDGVGFDPKAPKKEGVKLGGVGIQNVDQRIKLYYGEAYGVGVASKIGQGTTVSIRMPLIKQ